MMLVEDDNADVLAQYTNAITHLTVGLLKLANSIHVDGESEAVSRGDIFDDLDPMIRSPLKKLPKKARDAVESHLRQVLREFFEIRRSGRRV